MKKIHQKTNSENRENHAMEVTFRFISISRSVVEIQGLKVFIEATQKLRMNRATHISSWKRVRLLGIASAVCLQFGIGQ